MLKVKRISVLVVLILAIGMAACSPTILPTDEPTLEPEIETPVESAPEIEAPEPVPVNPPRVVLASGDALDVVVFNQIENLLGELIAGTDLELVVITGIAPEAITSETQVVVGVGSNLDINGLAANFPGVQFVVVGNPGVNAADNITMLGVHQSEIRQQAFMGGYLAAVISADYKIAALLPVDHPAYDVLAESFIIGARFYCGLCQPFFPPYNPFPQVHGLARDAGADSFRPVLNNFDVMDIDVVYVHKDLASPELISTMEELGIKAISDQSPETISGNWAGTIIMDPLPALQALWPELVNGNGADFVPTTIRLVDRDMGLVSAGRYRLFTEVAERLQAGMIAYEIVP